MNDITYTHKELATLVNVSETTIKSYRKKIPNCLPISNSGKPIRFSQDALLVCRRIKELFSEGMAVIEVQKRLSQEFDWIEEPTLYQETIAHEQSNIDDVAIPLNAIAQGVMNILQQQKDVIRRLKELEDTITSMKLATTTSVQEQKTRTPEYFTHIPQYLMEYPLVVQTIESGARIIEGLGLLPQFTLFDLLAKLNHNFKYPENYLPSTTISEQVIHIDFIQSELEQPQSFTIELLPIEHKGSTALLVVAFYVNNQQTPIETLMGFIQM